MPFHDAIAARRRQLGLSLQQLADRSGVSAAMLSEVERGRKSPTLRLATQIAEGLDSTVSGLLDEEGAPRVVVRRAGERRGLLDRRTGIERQSLAPTLRAHGIEVVWYVVPARRASGVFAPHPIGVLGHLTVVRGILDCSYGDERIRLGAGDSLDYPGGISHQFRNPGPGTCEFVLVIDGSAVRRPR